MGWMRDLVGDVDGCWLSFWLEIACCRKKNCRVSLCLFGQSYYVCFFW